MRVTLLGTGDTTGTPTAGCDCATCERARSEGVERTRFSVHVENEETGECLLVDASPDFRQQFVRSGAPLPDACLITHIHFDHLDGLGNTYRVVDSLPTHAADETDPETGESVADTVARKYDYLDAVTVHPETPFETFEVCGFDVTFVPVEHPPLFCYGLTIEKDGAKLALTGDTNYAIPEESRTQLRGADLLLADGLVPARLCETHPIGGTHHDEEGVPRTFGTKHMTREGAIDICTELGAEAYRLVHVSHFYDAEEAFEDPLAVDGETYTL